MPGEATQPEVIVIIAFHQVKEIDERDVAVVAPAPRHAYARGFIELLVAREPMLVLAVIQLLLVTRSRVDHQLRHVRRLSQRDVVDEGKRLHQRLAVGKQQHPR